MKVELAIIVPTLNEEGNIHALYNELLGILKEIDFEIIFIDDNSTDHTRDKIAALTREAPNVRLIHRIGRRGLSSACLEGMNASESEYILVMDADLQHDSRIIPNMLDELKASNWDLVIGSRFEPGAQIQGLSQFREYCSRFINRTLKYFTKQSISDPLSGFFMLTRSVYDETKYKISGIGFKILLDIILSAQRKLRIKEIPFRFRQRHQGNSKLDISITSEFVGLLIEKSSNGKFPMRFFMFICVGTVGMLIHFSTMWITYKQMDFDFISSQTLSTYLAMCVNFFLNNIFTYRDQRLHGLQILRGLALFVIVCSVGAANNIIIADTLYNWGMFWIFAALCGAIYGSVWNYFTTSILVWFKRK